MRRGVDADFVLRQERGWSDSERSAIVNDWRIDAWVIPLGACVVCPGCAREGYSVLELTSSEPESPYPIYQWDRDSEDLVCDSCFGVIA